MSTATATAFIETYCGIKLAEKEVVELHIGSLPAYVVWAPIFAAPEIVELPSLAALVEDVDFVWSQDGGIVDMRLVGVGRWRFTYTAGYSVANPIPTALAELLVTLGEMDLPIMSFQSERLGDYSYTLGEMARNAPSILSVLDGYRRLI